MAYTVAQLRKTNENNYYMEKLDQVTRNIFPSRNPFKFDEEVQMTTDDFQDFSLSPDGGFKTQQVYYVRFKVRCIPDCFYTEQNAANHDADVLRLALLLKESKNGSQQTSESTGETLYQQIGTCTIPTSTSSDITQAQYATFSMVFSPIQNYDTLIFKVQRSAYDIITHARNWLILDLCKGGVPPEVGDNTNPIILSEKQIEIARQAQTGNKIIFCQGVQQVQGDLAKLSNLVPKSDSNGKNWYKFGYQGRPGDFLVVNKQPIRVGRSGTYEFNNGLLVNSFMIAQPNGNVNAFLLDYAYESNS